MENDNNTLQASSNVIPINPTVIVEKVASPSSPASSSESSGGLRASLPKVTPIPSPTKPVSELRRFYEEKVQDEKEKSRGSARQSAQAYRLSTTKRRSFSQNDIKLVTERQKILAVDEFPSSKSITTKALHNRIKLMGESSSEESNSNSNTWDTNEAAAIKQASLRKLSVDDTFLHSQKKKSSRKVSKAKRKTMKDTTKRSGKSNKGQKGSHSASEGLPAATLEKKESTQAAMKKQIASAPDMSQHLSLPKVRL